MTFTNVGYAVLLALVVIATYLVPKKMQNSVLLIGSVAFYALNLQRDNFFSFESLLPLIALFANVVFTWAIAKKISKAEGKPRFRLTLFGVFALVLVLCVFKYYNAFAPTILGLANLSFSSLALPLGISFYTFATISYLVDVYRRDMVAEESLVNYAAFVTFFGTITSGPICRAQKILPQLNTHRKFDAQRTCDAFRLMLFGFFKWVAIANILGLYVNEIFKNSEVLGQYKGITLIFAAICYALQLYFEFSGYSDIARASAMLLGIDIPVNFKTPYFSTNFSSFWGSWHMSLSSWLQDYIFTPLVWSRWTSNLPIVGKKIDGKPPVISSLVIVFLISGFWHGNTMPFVVWGVLQAAYRVGEELLHQWYKKPIKKPKLPLRIFKTASVFTLWSISLVFFRIGTMSGGTVNDAFAYLGRIFSSFSVQSFVADTSAAVQAGFYTKPMMVAVYFAFLILVLCIAFMCDWKSQFRLKGRHISTELAKQKPLLRWVCYYVLIGCILVGYIMQSGGFGTVSFAYANF